MRILHAALKWDYGRPEQGYSFEHQTFYEALVGMGHDVIYFDYPSLSHELGREAMNRRLWEIVRAEEPDLLFCVLFEGELDQGIIRRISDETSTVTLNWFCDDHWRFHQFSRYWTPAFNWVVTTVSEDIAPYERFGLHNVIRSQWACNSHLYRRPENELPLAHEVTFVGMAHGNRVDMIKTLRRAGVDVRAWGSGWPEGRLSVEEMVEVFNRSRVNLNFANASVSMAAAERGAPALHGLRNAMRNTTAGRIALESSQQVVRCLARIIPKKPRYVMQLKARTFEVPGCGGFLLTQEAPELDHYLIPGREVGTFGDVADLIDVVRLYLGDEDLRHRVAEAGYARVIRDHTYERRFSDIFEQIGLASASL